MTAGTPVPAGARCLNCQTPLTGRFCSQCGQPADVHVPSTHELVHEVLEGLTHSDSRLWRTLKDLWFRPGVLTVEYVRGRRAAYLPPFRLYLVISVVFFLLALHSDAHLALLSFSSHEGHTQISSQRSLSENDCQEIDWFKDSHPAWHERLQRGCLAASRDSGQTWREETVHLLPRAMFVFVPLIALLHMLMYWWPRHRYAEHLVFFLHLHAFFFSMATLIVLLGALRRTLPALHWAADWLEPPLQFSLGIYTLLALKRVFARGWPLTVVKGVALFLGYWTLLGITVGGVFLYAALQL